MCPVQDAPLDASGSENGPESQQNAPRPSLEDVLLHLGHAMTVMSEQMGLLTSQLGELLEHNAQLMDLLMQPDVAEDSPPTSYLDGRPVL